MSEDAKPDNSAEETKSAVVPMAAAQLPTLNGKLAQNILFFLQHETLVVPAKGGLTIVHGDLCKLMAHAIQIDPPKPTPPTAN